MPANAKRTASDFASQFEPLSRVARMYERAGVTEEERMIPYHMSDSFTRLKDLLSNDHDGVINYIAAPLVTEIVDEMIHSDPEVKSVMETSKVFLEMNNEQRADYRKELIKTVVGKTWQDPIKFLQNKIAHKYRLAGFYERRQFSGGGLADAYLTLGVQKDEKKQHYSTWYGKGQIIRISHESAPSIYFTGEPGTGKTNGVHDLIEEMIANQYWVYTNMPIVSDYGHVMITRHYSDLYIDTPEMPSILRALIWARKHRIPSGSYMVYDEGGRGVAAKSTTLEGEALRAHLQLRRHFGSGFLQAGVQRMQARQEAEGLVDFLIETKRIDTGKTKKAENGKLEPVYRYYWDIATRGVGKTLHEYVYDIPFTHLTLNYPNELRLAYPLDMDMLNLESFEKAVDFVSTPLEQLVIDTRNYVRETYRPELIAAPIYGEDDDVEVIESRKEKEALHVAMETPVKKEEMNLSQDQIEAIGRVRKDGMSMMQISREFEIPIPIVTKICKQYGWL
jgi:hypothetical protein